MTKSIHNYSLLSVLFLFIGCNSSKKNENTPSAITETKEVVNLNTFDANKVSEIDPNIRSIYQDKKGYYWFGTNGAGAYRYDGKTILHFTVQDGLYNNQVQKIQEDQFGNIWLGTGLFGVSRFDGQIFTSYANKEKSNQANDWKIEINDLWFYAGGGVFHYNSNSFAYLPLAITINDAKLSQNKAYDLSPFAVYSLLKDTKGNLWFGTQAQGVCRYDGYTFTWFTEKGLAGPAVLGLFEDSKGNLWFGNNGSGLFRYDGKNLVNVTIENGLSNSDFRAGGQSNSNTLARIYAINEDPNGNLWIGTVDSGVWQYNGKKITHYTEKDGLSSKAINTIYKDLKGDLWFGTDSDGVFKFNGESFVKFKP